MTMYMQLLQNSLKPLLLEGSICKATVVLASRTWQIPLSSVPWYHATSWQLDNTIPWTGAPTHERDKREVCFKARRED